MGSMSCHQGDASGQACGVYADYSGRSSSTAHHSLFLTALLSHHEALYPRTASLNEPPPSSPKTLLSGTYTREETKTQSSDFKILHFY